MHLRSSIFCRNFLSAVTSNTISCKCRHRLLREIRGHWQYLAVRWKFAHVVFFVEGLKLLVVDLAGSLMHRFVDCSLWRGRIGFKYNRLSANTMNRASVGRLVGCVRKCIMVRTHPWGITQFSICVIVAQRFLSAAGLWTNCWTIFAESILMRSEFHLSKLTFFWTILFFSNSLPEQSVC